MNSLLKNVVLFLVSCLIAFGGIEVALRLWPDVFVMGDQYVFYEYDPVLGWDNRPNMQGQFSRIEFSYPVKINSKGMRDVEVQEKRPDEFRVAVLGDSFVWGVGAAYGERFTEIVEAHNPKINVLNFGASGYSPIQYLLQLDKVFSLQPDYVVVAICLGNDLTDNVRYVPYNHPKPYVRLSADRTSFEIKGYPLPDTKEAGPYLVGAAQASRIVGLIKLNYDWWQKPKEGGEIVTEEWMYVPPDSLEPAESEAVRNAIKLNELLLAAIKQRVDTALGINRLAVLLVPTKFEIGQGLNRPFADRNRVANVVLASLSRLGIPAVDGRAVIFESDFWKVDAHWRPSGHRKIGELLAKFLTEKIEEKTAHD